MLRAVKHLMYGFAVVMAGLFLGCQSGSDSTSEAGFKVALATPGSIRDAGWNQSAYEGLLRIEKELGAEIAHQETRTPQDFEAAFRDFAARGFDLVFGHGFEYQDAAAKVGRKFPDTVFITTSGNTIRPNVSPIVFELEQATYVLGFVAGSISRRAKIGAIGGIKIPSVESTFLAFREGAKRAPRRVNYRSSYIGNWTDVAAAREATLAQIAEGVDVLIHNANEAAHGFFQAAKESDGVLVFGTNRNQNDLAPQSVLASAILDIPRALLLVAREVESEQFWSRSIRFGLRDDVVKVDWNEALAAELPAGVRDAADALAKEIRQGTVQVPRGNF